MESNLHLDKGHTEMRRYDSNAWQASTGRPKHTSIGKCVDLWITRIWASLKDNLDLRIVKMQMTDGLVGYENSKFLFRKI